MAAAASTPARPLTARQEEQRVSERVRKEVVDVQGGPDNDLLPR